MTQPAPFGPVRAILGFTVSFSVLGVVLFASAGRLDWWPGWAWLGLALAGAVAGMVAVTRRNPGLMAHRSRIGAGTPTWDRVWLGCWRLCLLAAMAVAAADSARGLGPEIPAWVWPVGAALHLAGQAVSSWAMSVNAHFEGTVRIQTDRGHRVVSDGPYARVRHPGYVGFALLALAIPALFLSAWALVPVALSLALLVARTALEDRKLRAELPGYADYAATVRSRLVPGVW